MTLCIHKRPPFKLSFVRLLLFNIPVKECKLDHYVSRYLLKIPMECSINIVDRRLLDNKDFWSVVIWG